MNFVAQLEDYLRDLGAEARNNHPGVKEASERAILKLRTLQNAYASAVRTATKEGRPHPTTSMFQSSDLLHPFLLAANYPNASPALLELSFKAMKTLLEANAVSPGDGINLVRVWMIQTQVVVSYGTASSNGGGKDKSSGSSNRKDASSSGGWLGSLISSSSNASSAGNAEPPSAATSTSIMSAVSSSHGQAGTPHLNNKELDKLALDILSCLLQLLELRDLPVPGEQWVQSFSICCHLYEAKSKVIRQAAKSTLPQVLGLLFSYENATLDDFKLQTWNDLVQCLQPSKQPLNGAFLACHYDQNGTPQPPSIPLALELLGGISQSSPKYLSRNTIDVLSQVLEQLSISSHSDPLAFIRVLQFTMLLFQSQIENKDFAADCRALLAKLAKPIVKATESLRSQADFEDGYIFQSGGVAPDRKTDGTVKRSRNQSLQTLKGMSPTLLSKAALCTETLLHIIQDASLKSLWSHESILVQLLEACSDLCTIGASCEAHMMLLVEACHSPKPILKLLEPLAINDTTNLKWWQQGFSDSGCIDSKAIFGDAMRIGFASILKMIEALDESALEAGFAPSLSVLQHYLKRFPSSSLIVKRALSGYTSLARVTLESGDLLRRALLSSLCKLSLPRWGECDASCKLQDHNIAALICLVTIIHRFYNSIGSEWQIIFQTFQELSVLSIASPRLSDSAYIGALSISAVFGRFAAFSTCLSNDSLIELVRCLKEVAQLEQTTVLVPNASGGTSNIPIPNRPASFDDSTKRSSSLDNAEADATIGSKLMSLGARAVYGKENGSEGEDVPVAERTKANYFHDYQQEFTSRLRSSKQPLKVDELPFSIILLADIAMTNSFRYQHCGFAVIEQLCSLAMDSPSVQQFSMNTVAMIIMTHISGEGNLPVVSTGRSKILYDEPRQNQYLAVGPTESSEDIQNASNIAQSQLFAPLCNCVRAAASHTVVESSLISLHLILENAGHNLHEDVWSILIDAVGSLSSDGRSAPEWMECNAIGFKCLKLIVDDFLHQADASLAARRSLLDCCASFGFSRHDMNTSLTAIGLLWSIADQDSGGDAIDRALSKLVLLSSDSRAEVRNCAVNTLFSCIVGRGSSFTSEKWRTCIEDMIFKIYDDVCSIGRGDAAGAETAASEAPSRRTSRYKVNVHHSRDSKGKQWVATQSLVLRGLSRMLRTFFTNLLDSTDDGIDRSGEDNVPWFEDAWNKILGYSFDAATMLGGRDTLDLRQTGVELMVLCNLLSCKEGIHASIAPARVGTNMEVVNGALRSVRTPEKASNNGLPRSHSSVAEMWRENIFLDSFDVLDSFREHLETDGAFDESGLTQYMEPTQVQVLSKFAGDLRKLYDCCKEFEFQEDRSFSEVTDFSRQLAIGDSDSQGDSGSLVSRFVSTVAVVAVKSSTGPEARFLSQAQRSSLDLLEAMAQDGSPEALKCLTTISGYGFFRERDLNGKAGKGADVLANEASSILHKNISNESLSNECRLILLCRMLTIYMEGEDPLVRDGPSSSLELLISFADVVLEKSMAEFETLYSELPVPKKDLLDSSWQSIALSLSYMLSPILDDTTNRSIIAHPKELNDLVQIYTKAIPLPYRPSICATLSSGASKCLEVSIGNSGSNQDYLALFATCFAGACICDASEPRLVSTAEKVLDQASEEVQVLSSSDEVNSSNFAIPAAILMCEALSKIARTRQPEEDTIDGLVVKLFGRMCPLISCEYEPLRKAVGNILAQVDIGSIIATTNDRLVEAVQRAEAAEQQVKLLTTEVDELKRDKAALEHQAGSIF